MAILTEAEAEKLVAAQKIVSAQVRWIRHPRSWRLEIARVFVVPTRQLLDLHGVIGKTNHSFALVYQGYSIRKYTKHFEHRVAGKVFREPHKHFWTDEWGEDDAYVPQDIDPNSDVNAQFLAFCNECNIELVGGYQAVNYHIR